MNKRLRKMNGIKVGDIMTRNFVSVNPSTSLHDAAKEMYKKRVGSLILKEGQTMTGLLTERDVVWAITKKSRKDFKNIKAKDIATKKVVSIKPSADLSQALKKMNKHGFKWLPVMSNKKVIGLLTLKDIIKMKPELLESAGEMFNIREETEKLKRISGNKKWREGMCEECGNYDLLYKTDERLLCEGCTDSM